MCILLAVRCNHAVDTEEREPLDRDPYISPARAQKKSAPSEISVYAESILLIPLSVSSSVPRPRIMSEMKVRSDEKSPIERSFLIRGKSRPQEIPMSLTVHEQLVFTYSFYSFSVFDEAPRGFVFSPSSSSFRPSFCIFHSSRDRISPYRERRR